MVTQLFRQSHRWLSVAFTATVLANITFMSVRPGQPPAWVIYSPLIPLALLWLSGVYMFVLPYTVKRRNKQRVKV